jgi:hypothetical protein
MEVLVEKSLVETHEPYGAEWEAGFRYQLLQCFSCHEVTLYQLLIHTGHDPEGIDRSYDRVLYPASGESPSGLPPEVDAAWKAAMKVRKVDPNAFAVLPGRVLDVTCVERQAKGKTLNERIEDLTQRGHFPKNLEEVAHGLRKLRNFGAHGDLGTLKAADAPLLESLCGAILMYLYTAPALIKEAERRLAQI